MAFSLSVVNCYSIAERQERQGSSQSLTQRPRHAGLGGDVQVGVHGLALGTQALLDVQRLYRFLAPRNQDAAKRAVTAVRQDVKVLALRPGMGRPVEDMDDEFCD
jgi:hypothetical protein